MKESEKFIRLGESFLLLGKAMRRKEKAKEERIWIEKNKHINIINYPYYKLKRLLIKNDKPTRRKS